MGEYPGVNIGTDLVLHHALITLNSSPTLGPALGPTVCRATVFIRMSDHDQARAWFLFPPTPTHIAEAEKERIISIFTINKGIHSRKSCYY